MSRRRSRAKRAQPAYLVADDCHPQTIAVVRTRARGARHQRRRRRPRRRLRVRRRTCSARCVQYPATDGAVARLPRRLPTRAHAAGALVTVATDLLALTLLTPPGEWGADIAVGNASASACRWGTAARTRRSSPRATRYKRQHARAASSASRATRRQRPRCAWRSRPASSTSAATRRRATSARRRCCSRSWRACTRSTTAPRAPADRRAGARLAPALSPRLAAPGLHRRARRLSSTRSCVEVERLGPAAAGRRGARAADQPARARADPLCVALDETVDARRRGRPHRGLRAGDEALPFMLDDWRRDVERAIPTTLRAHERRTSRTRSSTATTPRPRCCATSGGSRPATCRSRTR